MLETHTGSLGRREVPRLSLAHPTQSEVAGNRQGTDRGAGEGRKPARSPRVQAPGLTVCLLPADSSTTSSRADTSHCAPPVSAPLPLSKFPRVRKDFIFETPQSRRPQPAHPLSLPPICATHHPERPHPKRQHLKCSNLKGSKS